MLKDGKHAGTIVQYVEDESATFEERPLCAVDALVLTQLAYLKWDRLEKTPRGIESTGAIADEAPFLRDLCDVGDFYTIIDTERSKEQKMTLLAALYASRRWRETRLLDYSDVFDEDAAKQFSATAFRLPDGSTFLAYRGTDSTIVGWREDFMLAFEPAIPSQEAARDYLERIAASTAGPLSVGGHSKGGNIAVYAAAACGPELSRRLDRVYDFDGPGFCAETLARIDIAAIAARATKIVPRDSTVGVLLESPIEPLVVASNAQGFAQHDAYTWLVADGNFEYCAQRSELSDHFKNSVSTWLSTMSREQKRSFTDVLFGVLGADGGKKLDLRASLADLSAEKGYLAGLDPQTREMFLQTIQMAAEASTEFIDPAAMIGDFVEKELLPKENDPITRFHELGDKLDSFDERYPAPR